MLTEVFEEKELLKQICLKLKIARGDLLRNNKSFTVSFVDLSLTKRESTDRTQAPACPPCGSAAVRLPLCSNALIALVQCKSRSPTVDELVVAYNSKQQKQKQLTQLKKQHIKENQVQ